MSKIKKFDKETGEIFSKKIRHQLTYKQDSRYFEKNTLPSETVEGQAMSVVDMIKRHRMGLPLDKTPGELYQGEHLRPNLENMDLIDRQAYIDSVADALVEVKTRIAQAAKTRHEREMSKKVEDEVNKQLKIINQPDPKESHDPKGFKGTPNP